MNWRNDISKVVEALAVNRKAAMDFGASKEEVDEYITNEAKKWFAKFDNMDKAEMMVYMMGRIISEGGVKDVLEILKGEDE